MVVSKTYPWLSAPRPPLKIVLMPPLPVRVILFSMSLVKLTSSTRFEPVGPVFLLPVPFFIKSKINTITLKSASLSLFKKWSKAKFPVFVLPLIRSTTIKMKLSLKPFGGWGSILSKVLSPPTNISSTKVIGL